MSDDHFHTTLTADEKLTNKINYNSARIEQKTDMECIAEILEELRHNTTTLQKQIDQLKKLRNQHEDYVVKLTEVNDADMQELSDRLEAVEVKVHGKR